MNQPPPKITVKKINKKDLDTFQDVIKLFENVFEMDNFSMPDPKHLQKLLSREDFIVLAALLKNNVVGGLTAYVLEQYYSKKPLAYIYDWQSTPNIKDKGSAENSWLK